MKALLDSVNPVELTEANIGQVPPRPGLYVLHHDGDPIYVGKADKNVMEQLGRHLRMLDRRKNLDLRAMTFRCITFASTWNLFKPEEKLTRLLGTNQKPGWSGKGFGSNEDEPVDGDE